MDLAGWLAHCERLHPKEIELTLGRVRVVRSRLGIEFAAPVIVVAGTNGKGSTCLAMASSRSTTRRFKPTTRAW